MNNNTNQVVKLSDKTGVKHDTRWKKGQSGNPNGRPLGSVSVVEAIKRKLMEIPEGQTNAEKRTYLDLLVARYFKQTIQDGDAQLIKDLINRVDGMPKQSINMEGEPIKIDISSMLDKAYGTKQST